MLQELQPPTLDLGGQGVAANSSPAGAGGVSTAGVSGPGAAATGPGGTGGGAGTAAGGSGTTVAPPRYTTIGSGLGFGLGSNGVGNNAAAHSNTAVQDSLANTNMRYGFVNGQDPGLANSATGQAALGTAQAPTTDPNYNMRMKSLESYGGVQGAPGYSSSQVAAINALMAARGGQGFGNAGFGGGSPSATVGGFGGNSSPTGAEGVSTTALGSPSVGIGSPSGPPGFGGSVNANAPSAHASNVMGVGAPNAVAGQNAVNSGTSTAGNGVNTGGGRAWQAQDAVEHQARGGYLKRANGGAIDVSSIPTNELIQYALDRIRQRRNAASGGTQTATKFPNSQSSVYNIPGGIGMGGNVFDPADGTIHIGDPGGEVSGFFTALGSLNGNQNQGSTAAAAPTPPPPTNTPAVASGTVGNHGGAGAVGGVGGASGSPIGGIPNAQPNGQSNNSTNPSGPQYNNSIDQALGTNNPTSDQIFGFTYPTIPPPKPQPVGPVPQSMINGEFGVGFGSQTGTGSEFFRAGGAVIMDAALNRARKAIKAASGGSIVGASWQK